MTDAQRPQRPQGDPAVPDSSSPVLAFPMLHVSPRRRYLVRFDPKRIPHMFADVLILGSGIAGVRAALAVDPKLRVVVVSKDRADLSNSAWAQGGIAGVLDPADNIRNHAADTMTAGAGLCDPQVVEAVVAAAPELIRELESFGAVFDQENGRLALTMEGGHSHPRVAHALGDATGKEVMRALIDRIRGTRGVEVWEKTFTIDLLTHAGACRGALVWNEEHGKTFVWAKQTILCTGGAAACIARPPIPASRRPTAMPSPIGPARKCATWS